MAAQTFIRWARLRVRERLLSTAQDRGIGFGMTFLDGTSVRAPAKAAGATKTAQQRRSWMSVGPLVGPKQCSDPWRFGTRVCVIADSTGRAVAFSLAPGQAHEMPLAVPLLATLPGVPLWVVGDRGYSSHAFRQHVWDLGARPPLPPGRNEVPIACPD